MLKSSTTAAYAKKVTAAAKKNSLEKIASDYYLISCQRVEGDTYRLTKLRSFVSVSELGCLRYVVKHIITTANDKASLFANHIWIKKFVDVSVLKGDVWKEDLKKAVDNWSYPDRVERMKVKVKGSSHITWIQKTESTRILFH